MSLGVMGSSAGASAGPVTGTYTGTGSDVTLTFSKAPSCVIIVSDVSGTTPTNNRGAWAIWINGLGRIAYDDLTKKWEATASGNTLTISDSLLLKSGTVFNYIAFF